MERIYVTDKSTRTVKPLFRVTQVVWYVVGIIEALLLIRFFLRLFDANAAAGFSQFIFQATGWLAAPFLAVFNPTQVGATLIEWSTLLAMLVYWFLAWAIIRLVTMARPISTAEADAKLERQDVE